MCEFYMVTSLSKGERGVIILSSLMRLKSITMEPKYAYRRVPRDNLSGLHYLKPSPCPSKPSSL
jgi:hypothetical protein